MPNSALAAESTAVGFVRAEHIASQIQDRTIGVADVAIWPLWRAVYVERGSVRIVSLDATANLDGPCVAWIPWSNDNRLRIYAGTVGAHVAIGGTLLKNVIGYKAESADLRLMIERQTCVSFAENTTMSHIVAQCFDGMVREVQQGAASSLTVIEALLRIMLIELWRARGAPGSYDAANNPSQRFMNSFNNLVETRFREHWTVADYAGAIGISADRLNDICRRNRGTTPKQLIKARLATEARLLLENSTHSVEQIAGLLGFPSAAQFNRFFRNSHDVPPGRYRQRTGSRSSETRRNRGGKLYEWP